MNKIIVSQVIQGIVDERARQDTLVAMGKFKHTCADTIGISPSQKFTVLTEEVGEVARVLLNLNGLATDYRAALGDRNEIDATMRADLEKELTQVAAICVAWLEGIRLEDRDKVKL